MKLTEKDLYYILEHLAKRTGNDLGSISVFKNGDKIDVNIFDHDNFHYEFGKLTKIIQRNRKKFLLINKRIRSSRIESRKKWGIEIECLLEKKKIINLAGQASILDIINNIQNANNKKIPKRLIKDFFFTEDGSIEKDSCSQIPIEFVSNIFRGSYGIDSIKMLFDIFEPKFNYSCGIHVHVEYDQTKGSPKEMQTKLYYLLPLIEYFIIFDIINNSRKHNEYVLPLFSIVTDYDEFEYSEFSGSDVHFHGTNVSNRYNTLEFRYLEGTSDVEKIEMMVKLYLQITNALEKSKLSELKTIYNRCNFIYDNKLREFFLNYPPKNSKSKKFIEARNLITSFLDSKRS
jgi:hypothetical protein